MRTELNFEYESKRRHFISDTVLEKMYQELLGFLKKQGKKYVPRYYLRGMSMFLDDNNYKNLVGVEIGVADGTNAVIMFKHLDMKKLYLVDPYIKYFDGDDKWKTTSHQKDLAHRRLCRYDVEWIEEYSDKAVSSIPKGVDFVYIDGNHSYDFVKKDIELYYPLVRKGGVIGGNDYNGNTNGVVKAVTEFIMEKKLKVYFGRHDDWWVVK